jgi:hypothetical protein
MMFIPWIFGFEVVQQGWQAQSALAFRLMRSFTGGDSDQPAPSPLIPDTVADDIKAQDEVVAIAPEREAPAFIADARGRKVAKVLRASKKKSHMKTRSVSKRAAAARQNSATKVVRGSKRKPR